jgi:DNA-binding XRE family transcriptional regulator
MRLKIRKLRREREMTQKELATYLDVKQSTICGWEKSTIIPPLDKCLTIATVFGVSIYDLIDEDDITP